MAQRTGRPRGQETQRRTRELLERIAAGEPPLEAARNAHVKPERVLTLLGDDAFFAVFAAVRSGELPATAAVVHLTELEPETPEAEAA